MNFTAEEYNLIFREKMYFNTILTSLFLLLGTAGNAVVIYFYAFRISRTEDRYFIPYLAVADLLACAFGCVFSTVINFYRVVFVWEYACKFLYFFTWSTSTISAAMLLVIAVNRYLKVCRPNSTQMTPKTRKLALTCTVLLSIIITLPVLHFMGPIYGSLDYNDFQINVTTCGVKKELVGTFSKLFFFFELLLSLINMIITVALYIPIGIIIYQRFHSIRNSKRVKKLLGITNSEMSDVGTSDEASESSKVNNANYKDALQNVLDTSVCDRKNSHRRRIRHNFTSMFVTIVLVYVMSYLPTLILIILPSKDPFAFWFYRDDVSLNILVILKRAFIINHIVNPFIYGYFDLHFRSLFLQSFLCRRNT